MALSNSFGAYVIMNILRKECYIGFTKDSFARRWTRHCWGLRCNKHECPALQTAWNADGEDRFVFAELEVITDKASTTEPEQRWMQYYRARGFVLYNEIHNGYTPSPATRAKLRAARKGFRPTAGIEARMKDWDVLTPDGEVLHIHNLSAFCREHALDISAMHKVLTHQRGSCKGYRAPADQPRVLSGELQPLPTPEALAAQLVCPICGQPKRRPSATCRACYQASDRFREHLCRIAPAGNLAANKVRWGH